MFFHLAFVTPPKTIRVDDKFQDWKPWKPAVGFLEEKKHSCFISSEGHCVCVFFALQKAKRWETRCRLSIQLHQCAFVRNYQEKERAQEAYINRVIGDAPWTAVSFWWDETIRVQVAKLGFCLPPQIYPSSKQLGSGFPKLPKLESSTPKRRDEWPIWTLSTNVFQMRWHTMCLLSKNPYNTVITTIDPSRKAGDHHVASDH